MILLILIRNPKSSLSCMYGMNESVTSLPFNLYYFISLSLRDLGHIGFKVSLPYNLRSVLMASTWFMSTMYFLPGEIGSADASG